MTTIVSEFIGERPCMSCGAVAVRKTIRFRCGACGADNRVVRHGSQVRAKTEQRRSLERGRVHLRLVSSSSEEQRPPTRAHCKDGPRPCPWISCRHHLAYEVTKAGGLKEKFPGRELEELAHTCALDVADLGPQSLDTIAFLMNVTQERVRQIEESALDSFRRSLVFTKDDI